MSTAVGAATGSRVGDREDFTDFVRTSSAALLRSAWLLVGDWAGAEDLVQSALAKSWPRWPDIAPAARRAYVRTVITRTYLDSARGRVRELPLDLITDLPAAGDRYEGADLRDALVAAIRTLPPRQRAVVTLRYFEDLSERDTADALGCSVGAVKSHAARAMKALRAVPGVDDLDPKEQS